jgi:zinc transport system ATP-binding protein
VSDGPPLLEIDGLTVRRGGETLLDDVSLTVPRRSVTVLVGPNGAGKSTLLAAVLGEIEFRGRIRMHWRGDGRIGFVPQGFAVDKTLPLTALEFLALSRQRRPVCLGIAAATRARAERLLAAADLAGLGGRALGQLSGGELQRLLVEHALDPVPELLLLDEPATGLDAAASARFEERVQRARHEADLSVLMVSHDLAQVRRLADHVLVLDRRVVRRGDATAA